jgi:hypothetical protein
LGKKKHKKKVLEKDFTTKPRGIKDKARTQVKRLKYAFYTHSSLSSQHIQYRFPFFCPQSIATRATPREKVFEK